MSITKDETLIDFFTELLSSLKNDNISSDKKKRAGEFYITDKFFEINNHKKDSFSKNDIIKYVLTGWYIFNITNVIEN